MAPPGAVWKWMIVSVIFINFKLCDGTGLQPTFDNFATPVTVAEDTGTSTSIFQVMASDPESDPLTITMDTTGSPFTFTSPDLFLGSPLDYENIASYPLDFTVTDGTTPVTGTLTVDVTDVNDHTPICSPALYFPTVNENTAVDSSVQAITCTDGDGTSPNRDVTLSIISGDDATAKFKVNGMEIQTTATPLDYETKTTYTLIVDVVDGGATPLTGTATVIVTVGPLNEVDPVWGTFTPACCTFTVTENVNPGTLVVTLASSDADDGTDGDVTYSLVSIRDSTSTVVTGIFEVDSTLGVVKTKSALNYEAMTSYTVVVRATDGGSRTVDETLTIDIGDYNDQTPVFASSSYTSTLLETATTGAGVAVVGLVATDGDSTSTLVYSIEDGDTTRFQIGAAGLELKTAIDLDTPSNDPDFYLLRVIVKDGGSPELTGTASVTVSITAVNEHDPVFGAGYPVTLPVGDSTAQGTLIDTVAASDDDSGVDGDITFSISAGNTDSDFSINPTSGEITLVNTLNVVTKPTYALTVKATDNGATPRSAMTTVTVNVNSVNDNSPACPSYIVFVNMLESSVANDPVTTLACTDADGDAITYTITSGGANFAITNAGGAMTLTGALNYDSATTSYAVQVTVSDGTNNRVVTVNVIVDPVNEDTPAFASNPSVSVSESDTSGTVVTTYTADDTDYSPHDVTQYDITAVSQTGLSKFAIDQSSGVITLVSPLDYDTLPPGTKFYEITVLATDGGTLSGSGTVTVNVDNVNDNAPVCTATSWTINVPENTAATTTLIGSLGCTDVEDGTTLTFAITQSPGTHFGVSAAGAVTLDTAVNYEANQAHTLTITVTDGGSPAEVTTLNINVAVGNINEDAPVIAGPLTANIDEEQATGTNVPFTFSASDTDTADVLTYTLSGTHSSYFSMESTTGAVKTAQVLDRDAATAILVYDQLVLTVTDSASQTATASLTVTLDDINDIVPACSDSTYYVTVPENSPVDTNVQTLTCTDDDASPNGDMTLSIISGDDATAKFKVTGMGIFTTATALDYESLTTYTLVVDVADGGGTPLTGTATIVVTVTPVNEDDPVWGTFSPACCAYTVPETVIPGTLVLTMATTDADQGSTHGDVTYSLVSTTDAGGSTVSSVFEVDASSGTLSTLSNLDYETSSTFSVVVRATDGGGRSVDNSLTIDITDYNDHAPVFSLTSYSGTLLETAATGAGVTVVAVAATDADATSTLSYDIESGDTTRFQFGATGLELKTAINLDSPADDPNIYLLRIIVKDGGSPELTGTASVTVSITAVNDHDPVFSAGFPSTVSLPDSSPLGTVVDTVAATDLDVGTDGDITFSITAGDPTNDFDIDSTTGIITVQRTLDFATTPTYDLRVVATDGGATARVATTTVTVNLNAANTNSPSCTSYVEYVNMAETSIATTPVITLTCTDADGDTLTYTITSGGANFDIDSASGAMTLTGALNYDSATTSYAVQVEVSDGTNSRIVTVNVIVDAVNEDTPAFASNPSVSLSESDTSGTVVTTYTADDTDYSPHDITQYDITAVTQSGLSKFAIDQTSGAITLVSPLDYDTLPPGTKFYEITVLATDGGAFSGSGTVTVNVNDVNDNAPVCTATTWTITVDENTATTTNVIPSLGCTDVEDGTTLTYGISQTPGTHFGVTAGVVTLDIPLDFETNQAHTLTITVTDGGSPPEVTTLTVNVAVGNINENAPVIAGSLTANIDEEQPTGTNVPFTFSASDIDTADVLTYTLSGVHSSYFSMESTTGAVKTAQVLDRDAASAILVYDQLVLTVTDSAAQTATASLTITLDDINDIVPACSDSTYYATVPENSPVDTNVQALTCTDNDASPNGDMTLSIVSGDDATAKFKVTGMGIFTTATALDYETSTSYSLVVDVIDGGATPNTGTLTIIVMVSSINEADPVWGTFSPVCCTYSVMENVNPGTLVATMATTDADTGPDGDVTYSLVSTTDFGTGVVTGIFYVNPITGTVSTNTALDYESMTSYTLAVRATDGGGRTTDNTLTINIADYNDHIPIFSAASYSNSMLETATTGAGVTVITVAATDADSTATLTYVIEDGDTTSFQFVGADLELRTAIDLDSPVSDPDFYTLRIIAKDGGSPELTGTASVTVSITAVNEHDPVFAAGFPSTVAHSENSAVGTVVETVVATDLDVGTDGVITYTISGGNTNGDFDISPSDGKITIKNALDFATTPTYTLSVTASDAGATIRSAVTTITINVNNVNDNFPSCPSYNVFVNMPEDSAASDPVTTLACTDADGDTLTYTKTSGSALFAIDPASGAMTLTAASLDYDSVTTSYAILVDVSDGTNNRIVTVNVIVDAVNEDTPAFASNPSVSVSESDTSGTVVTTYTADDTDYSPHDVTQYDITAVTQSGLSKFSIETTTGVIKLVATVDYDTLPAGTKFYEITVEARDGGALTGTGTVTVNVDDVNDNAPSCSPSSWTLTVDEDTTATTTVIPSLGCTDVEDGTTLTYAITQTPGTHFGVTAGAVTLDTALDYESNIAHTLEVVVEDGGAPAQSTTVTININVGNINDGPPSFTGTFAKTIAENIAADSSVIDVVATDPDGNNNLGSPVYSILSGDPTNQFSIDPNTGRIKTLSGLDRENTASYALIVKATESGDTGTATVPVTITISDINDTPPSCTQSNFVTTVSEAETAGFAVNTLTCTDDDTTGTVTYTLTSGDATKFEMSANILQLKNQLDFDSGTIKYDVTVTVSDGINSVVVAGTVHVSSVNQAPPVFAPVTYSVSFAEDTTASSSIATVVATDADSAANADGQITYAFDGTFPLFLLDSASGLITLASPLDWETGPSHVVLVTATDGVTTVTATVSVTVTDVNEHAPVFGASSYSGSATEADTIGTTVVTVVATDADDAATNGNGVVTYSIIVGNTNSDFTINANTGVLTTAKLLDYETTTTYLLTVQAVDRSGDAQSKSSTAVVSVTVGNVNEFDPIFSPAAVGKSVPETTALGATIHVAVATDADDGVDGTLTYTMPAHATFTLDTDGTLILKDPLSVAASPYTLTVTATDDGTPAKSADLTLTVTVDDVNTVTPSCSPSSVVVTLREDATGNVATLSCTDTDTGASGTLTYTIVSVNSVAGTGPFAVGAATGVVTIGTALDYESDPSHSIIIRVEDGAVPALSTSVTVDVSVSDLNEAPPVFSGTPFNPNMDESEVVGYTIITVAATDADTAETITYHLTDTTNAVIGASTGIVTLKEAQDRETAASLTTDVCATDSGTVLAVRQTCETITVTITDVNDNDPIFNPGVYTANVDENSPALTTVTTVTATDMDAGAFGTITFSIVGGNTNNVFTVDANLGHVTVDTPNTFLDYEITQAFSLTVRATDGGGQTADTTVSIDVNPINEGSPTFAPTTSTETIAEDSATGVTVIDLGATDTDSGLDGQITYSITAGANGKFTIDPTTGIVTVSGVLDIETAPTYTITIQATDAGVNPSNFVGTYTLGVTLTDVNDFTPSCSLSLYSASITESAAPATSVQQLACTDQDNDAPNNVLTYTEVSGDPGNLFEVDASTGLVSTAAGAAFDRETTASYTLDISVSDGGTGVRSVDIQVVVTITDENDETPTFGSDPYTPSVTESAALGTAFITLAATDGDTGLNGEVVYSILTGNGLGHFALDSSTGALSVQANLDRETTPQYVLEVQAQDRGSPTSLVGTSTVSITVTDANDNAPICATSVYTATTAEDTATTTSLVTVACTDDDDPPNNNIQYSITAGNTASAFAIDSTTGEVTVNAALDMETVSSYSLTVEASDGTLSTTVAVVVSLTDVNEFDPAFTPVGPYSDTIPEDTATGTTVRTIAATDADASNPALTYSITLGNGDGRFWMNPSTGDVVLQAVLDRENVATYSLTIEVADGTGAGSRTATTIHTVNVGDVNDNSPFCTPSVYITTLPEDSGTGTTVSSLTCSDPDSSTPVLAYTIIGGNGEGKFTIDSASGIMTILALMDYETTTSYDLDVEVSDQGATAKVITIPVQVNVDPVNEHDPVFDPVTAVSIPEDTAIATSIYQVTATDADTGALDGTIRFSIVSGDALGQFSIDQGTGEIKTVGNLDRESIPSYSLTVRATDGSTGNERSADIILSITLTDVNDHTPTFNPVVYAQNVLESAPSGSTLVVVTTQDGDDVPNATPVYSVISGDPGGLFTFVGNELLIAAGQTLDYETATVHSLDIQVTDSGSPPLTSNGMVVITVLSVNEFPPIPGVPNDSITMSENTPVGANIYSATATDGDSGTDGQFVWSITAGNTPTTFFCAANVGDLFTASVLDFDNPPSTYNLTVEAQDQGGLTGSFWLEIILTDENDEYPIFTETLYQPLLNENVGTGAPVVTVVATDNDSGVNGQVTYSITSGDTSYFNIDGTTGAITTAQEMDYETRNVFFLILEAVDNGSPALSTVGGVKVTVVDLNDNPPVFINDNVAYTISEDVATTTSVATVVATDADSAANSNNIFTYSLTDTFFEVNPATGQISTKALLDRETAASHTLTIYATDQGTPPLEGTATVTVILDDVNDNDPVITGTYSSSISEDSAVDTIVFTIAATDLDAGVNADLEFVIISGNTDGDFKIGAGSGIVQTANTLDRERTTDYSIVIHAIDKGAPRRTASTTVSVIILDINDNYPIFVTSPYTFNIAENVPIGSTVGTIQATDLDALVNAALTYHIIVFWSGDASHFTIDTASGEITTTGNLDRESITTYELRCQARDGGTPQLTVDVNVTITIDDLNDNVPVFNPNAYTGTVSENEPIGFSILTVTATDADPHNGEISFSIDMSTTESAHGATFLDVDATTGVVSVNSAIDQETDTYFNITVLAIDNGTVPLTASAIVYITVTDLNDNNPVFASVFINSEVSYLGNCDATIATLTATDADPGTNGVVSYYLSSNPYGFYFEIGTATGTLELKSPVTVNTKYVLEATAADAGSPQLESNPVAAVRVDTFNPAVVAVVVRTGISRADFLLRQTQFVDQFQAVMRGTYPTCVVKIWCIQERSGEAVPAPTRRRLLATNPVNVNLVVVSDNSTEDMGNLGNDKDFLTSSQITEVVTSGVSGTPATALTGAAWDYYVLQNIVPYAETYTPWYQSTEGIVFIVLACLLLLALIAITIFAICWCRKKRRPVTPTRVTVREERPNKKAVFVSRAAVPDIDLKEAKRHPPPAVVSLPMPAKASYPVKPASRGKSPRVSSADSTWASPSNRKRDNLSTPRTPRSIIVNTDNDGFFIKNRHFDGTAVDPMTGKVYEYNTKTNERRWLSTPDGKAVVASRSGLTDGVGYDV